MCTVYASNCLNKVYNLIENVVIQSGTKMSQLSRGILQKLFHKVHTKADGPVVLQATAVKSVNVQGVERVRVKCSDGQFENQMAMFSGKIESLPAFSVFKMTNWNVSSQGAPDKTILQIESFDIIQQPAEVQS